jgi:ABC-2 type transport system ATP-binding protein
MPTGIHPAPGTIYALVGPNGAGKSTTVKILTTLAIADEGTAIVEGIDVRADPARARRAIGVVGQRSGADPTATGRPWRSGPAACSPSP